MEQEENVKVRARITIKPSIQRQTLNLGKVQKLKKFFGMTAIPNKPQGVRVFDFSK
jgi:hypothetical protein